MNELGYEKENIDTISMEMILHAGNARLYLEECMRKMGLFHFQEAKEALHKAEEELKIAHIQQTKVIQGQASGIKYEYSVLFTHAQDTLMTINSELNLTQQLLNNYEILDQRLKKLEKQS